MSLEVLVDKQTASQLNSGTDKLYDILVLHLDGGKDLFITVTGLYYNSIYVCIPLYLCYLLFSVRCLLLNL